MDTFLVLIGIILVSLCLLMMKNQDKRYQRDLDDIYKIHKDIKEYYYMVNDILVKIDEMVELVLAEKDEKTIRDELDLADNNDEVDNGEEQTQPVVNIKNDFVENRTEKDNILNFSLESNLLAEEFKTDDEKDEKFEADDFRRKVMILHHEGYTLAQIAKMTQRGVREVEVVVKMMQHLK